HPSVAPFHLEILQDNQGDFLLTDLNSLYGTTVNGYRIQGMVQLRPTDIVKAGEIMLPWNNYFLYQPPVHPTMNPYPPTGGSFQNPAYAATAAIPVSSYEPRKPMNKKKLFMIIGGSGFAVLLCIAAIIYFYTRPSFAHLKLIPSEAFIVASIDIKGIAEKVDLEKMQRLDFFTDMKREARGNSDALSQVMSDPMSSGIDIFSQPYGFVCVENDDRLRFTGGVAFAIKNEDDFRIFISRLSQDESIKQSENYSILRIQDGIVVAWNDDAAVFIFSDKSKTRTENYCRSLFEQSEKESILSFASFNIFKEAQYDIGFFVNYDALKNLPGVTLPSYLSGSTSMATISFNDGKLSYSNEYFPSASAPNATQNILGKKGINDALKATIPGKSYGIASLSVDMNELFNYMDKNPDMSENIQRMADRLELDRKQLAGIFSGDFYGSLSDVKPMPVTRMDYHYNYDQHRYTYEETTDTLLRPSYVFGATVKNKTILDTIIARSNPSDTLHGIRFFRSYRNGNTYVATNGMNYFITNDYPLAISLSQGKPGVAVSGPMAALISNDPVYSYFNLKLEKYPPALSLYMEDEMGKRDFNDFETVISIFDYAELTGDGVKQNLDIYFVGKDNCLNTFLATANKLYLNHQR
ncbi:MAG: DUF4836 family protein, partial [Bacteroidota bacterium]|nr:DUF4836 family protein [Bacteroidota bacterium]